MENLVRRGSNKKKDDKPRRSQPGITTKPYQSQYQQEIPGIMGNAAAAFASPGARIPSDEEARALRAEYDAEQSAYRSPPIEKGRAAATATACY